MRPRKADLIKRKVKCSIKEVQSGFCSCVDLAVLEVLNTELKQRRRRRQRELPKSNRFRLAKQQLCTCITLSCTFLSRGCMTTTWKCQISQLACSRRSDSRAREKNSRRKQKRGETRGRRGERTRSRSLALAPPPVLPPPLPVFPVYNLTRSPFTAELYYLNAWNRLFHSLSRPRTLIHVL